MLEDDFNAKVEEKVLDERRVIQTLNERIEGQKQATEQARDDLMKMADDKADIERQLADREHQCKLYEKKHGLEEAVAHQKELKLEIRRRDRELSKINHKLSEQLEANDLLTATLRKLKIDYNLPPDFEYPKLELREEIRSEKERLRADNIMWEQQNAELEAERTRLLQALRTQAQLSSVKGFKQFGLNAEQILQLNYFATQLKKGVAASDITQPTDSSTRGMARENESLKEKVRKLEIKLEMFEDGNYLPSTALVVQQQQQEQVVVNAGSGATSPGSANTVQPKEISLLTNEISSLRRENERLKTELPKIIQESMDEFRDTIAADATRSGGDDKGRSPPRESSSALRELERKLAKLEESHLRQRVRIAEEEDQLHAQAEDNREKSQANINESMKQLEKSMHEQLESARGPRGHEESKAAISEMVEKLKRAHEAEAEKSRENNILLRKVKVDTSTITTTGLKYDTLK